jgi:hypothetical protein
MSGTNHNLSTRKPSVVVYGKLIHDRDNTQQYRRYPDGILHEAVEKTSLKIPGYYQAHTL